MRLSLASLFVAGVLATGCYGTSGSVAYSSDVAVASPDLVYVSPGVSVIADYDEPIFYADGYYWRNYNGGWYRSGYYTGGWVSASAPYAVVSIRSPHRYTHYRPNGYVRGRVTTGTYRPANRGYYRPANRPVYRESRDHRNYRPSSGRPVHRGGRHR